MVPGPSIVILRGMFIKGNTLGERPWCIACMCLCMCQYVLVRVQVWVCFALRVLTMSPGPQYFFVSLALS